MKAANLALRFALELCVLAAVAYWGSRVGASAFVNVVVAIAAPLAVAALWGMLLAPNANRRLDPPIRWALELAVLALGAAALVAVNAPLLGAALAVVAVANAVLLHSWGLDEDAGALSRRPG
ncbi:MAG TPA: YrdB family protein [Thermoleophilaceae bacterium]|nr:YrdB family protein [Thermoleophilaceae bacterium]